MMQDVRDVEVPASQSEEVLGPPNEIVLDAVGEGTPEAQGAQVVAAEQDGANHEYFLGMDSTAWVAVACVIFVAILVWQKVPSKLVGALDSRSSRIRSELEEAKALRAEAEAMLAEQQRKAEQSAKDAEAILENARTEAAAMLAEAEKTADAMVERRKEAAETKISAAERTAERELRARVAALATTAAERLIADEMDAAERQAMTDKAISDLNARLN
ncbi:hypothetical protein B5C34_12690 [Pacificimonas flava]|uniref:ATP synthase subunit b n=2 Tax=Pacificimonas TaxID=1960290 RepID=A0A219B772_9SPHN|nr:MULTISPECIES: F0F1 ATP synthase subunit B [Pacificimonas]MBZ6378476.1 F0F1 ATP synthase subunit B [Pacificimonas aurantium]OWV34230.1 hypothetical protein B5C34_12690 [Pacificimonas flava]